MLHRLRLLLEMIRFSHTLFALPFALLAAVMAWRDGGERATPWRWQDLAGIVVCMVFARGTAMAFNRLADRHLDAQNPRTWSRHIPAGRLSVANVAVFALVCASGFVASTLLFLPNRWPLYLSAPVLAFLCGYSLTKRCTALAHFWLGAALMLAPIAAWIALRGEVAWPPVVLGASVMLWVAGFDMIYACQDVETDAKLGLYSMPARVGVVGALRLAAFCHLGMIALLFSLPWVYPQLGWIYLAGITVAAALLVYEHWLVRPDDLTRVNLAFFHVNAVLSVGLFVVGTVDLLVK
ncbi:MAG TPA: UbiA-like polyprenyltransferase [Pirellulales bacterium]|nr:UbiA-like polyprenyltransferase [Pirellulales bacterium]